MTKRQELAKEDILPFVSQRLNLDDAAKHLGVSTSTLKRRIKEHGIQWTRANKSLKRKTEPSRIEYSQQHVADQTNGVADEHTQEYYLDAANDLLISPVPLRWNGSSTSSPTPTMGPLTEVKISTTYTLKVAYKDDTVKINFPCLFTFDQLKEEIGRKFDLELSSFKVKYLDKERDLVSVVDDASLQLALDEFGDDTVRFIICENIASSVGEPSLDGDSH